MRYGPKQVVERLHIASSTLRLWSTEFAEWLSPYAQPPKRACISGRRAYTDDDVRTLEFVEELLQKRLTYAAIKDRLRERAQVLARQQAAEERQRWRERRLRRLEEAGQWTQVVIGTPSASPAGGAVAWDRRGELGTAKPGVIAPTTHANGAGATSAADAASAAGADAASATHALPGAGGTGLGSQRGAAERPDIAATIRALQQAAEAKDQTITILLREMEALEQRVREVQRERDQRRDEALALREQLATELAAIRGDLASLGQEVRGLREDLHRQDEARELGAAQEARGKWRWPRRAG